MLDGATVEPPPFWKEYVVMKAMGWSPAEYDAAPAHLVDWIEQFLIAEGEHAKRESDRASRG